MPLHTIEELLFWIAELNRTVHVSIQKNRLEDSEAWYYNEAGGYIENRNKSFFRVMGMQELVDGQVVSEQPMIIQNEIGYLGILCRRFKGEMHCLMQAKIEPGNINHIQISPTIQATKSNFTQKHKGDKPPYLDYFLNASKYRIVVDQIQSEQSSRFYKKRNRNIILEVDEDIPVLPSHRWMTVGQLKELMRHDNLVNMDTRTVLSCLPLNEYIDEIKDPVLKRSAEGTGKNILPEIYQYINNYKMFDESRYQLVPLYNLENWHMRDGEFVCDHPYSFKVVFCDIEIEGREVRHWTQPLFEAVGSATFGLVTTVDKDARVFLVRAKPEAGCFDKLELGPTIQREATWEGPGNEVDKLFDAHLVGGAGVRFDTYLSEEGGRFYHEQNRNVVLEIEKAELLSLPEGYFWVDYKTLNDLVQINNCLNIQLRNLLSVLEW